MKPIKISRQTKDNLIGLFYLTPFLIGVCIFFLFPIISSLMLSFGDLDHSKAGFAILVEGWKNYNFPSLAFTLLHFDRSYSILLSILHLESYASLSVRQEKVPLSTLHWHVVLPL